MYSVPELKLNIFLLPLTPTKISYIFIIDFSFNHHAYHHDQPSLWAGQPAGWAEQRQVQPGAGGEEGQDYDHHHLPLFHACQVKYKSKKCGLIMFCFSYHSPVSGTKQNNVKTYFITNQREVEFANLITSQHWAKKSPARMY